MPVRCLHPGIRAPLALQQCEATVTRVTGSKKCKTHHPRYSRTIENKTVVIDEVIAEKAKLIIMAPELSFEAVQANCFYFSKI